MLIYAGLEKKKKKSLVCVFLLFFFFFFQEELKSRHLYIAAIKHNGSSQTLPVKHRTVVDFALKQQVFSFFCGVLVLNMDSCLFFYFYFKSHLADWKAALDQPVRRPWKDSIL